MSYELAPSAALSTLDAFLAFTASSLFTSGAASLPLITRTPGRALLIRIILFCVHVCMRSQIAETSTAITGSSAQMLLAAVVVLLTAPRFGATARLARAQRVSTRCAPRLERASRAPASALASLVTPAPHATSALECTRNRQRTTLRAGPACICPDRRRRVGTASGTGMSWAWTAVAPTAAFVTSERLW